MSRPAVSDQAMISAPVSNDPKAASEQVKLRVYTEQRIASQDYNTRADDQLSVDKDIIQDDYETLT